ncbi:MAG: hypothetical protein HOP15_14215 [Planctomycetes bacterium]|nr:hypothetical protein [Planctomycetota bacterium]
MKTPRRFAPFLIFVGLTAACRPEPADDGAPAVLSLVRSETILARYGEWEAARSSARSDATLEVALSFARGFSDAPTEACGSVVVDSAAGSVAVDVIGLGSEPAVSVWLVDNQDGPGASTLPDPNDRMLHAGRIDVIDGRARGNLSLDAGALEGFELDRVVVARLGDRPQGRVLLLGAPGAFERLHRSARSAGEVELELESLVRRGAELFERETFGGNGRTCTTCHPASNNLTIDPTFIATLASDDPLFVAERDPQLAQLENPTLLRERGLILENLDGFERAGVLRAVPHTFALATSVAGPTVPFDNTLNPPLGIVPPAERTGWSGDGAPGSGSLRDFALGAVVQHFTRSLERVPGRDFRVPTDDELDALEVFQLALGRDQDPALSSLRFRSPIVARGREIFLRVDTAGGTLPAGKCTLCHSNAGANIDAEFFSGVLGVAVEGNANFGTGVNNLAALPGKILDPLVPRDGGFARVPHDGNLCQPPLGGFGTVTPEGGALPPGLCEEDFNTPPLVEAADTPPFFHNNAVDTLEAAVAFYNDRAFNESAGGGLLAALDSGGVGIRLDSSEVTAVAHLLRVVNVLENLRSATDMARLARESARPTGRRLLGQVEQELGDAITVLEGALLHPRSAQELRRARELVRDALAAKHEPIKARIDQALSAMERARDDLVE